MSECSILNPQTKYQLEKTGIWGEVVRQRKEIIINNFKDKNPLKKGYPEGHVDLNKFLSIPIFENNKIIAVVGVANKEEDYDENDVINLKLFMNIVFKELDKIRINKEFEKEKQWSQNIINEAPIIIIGLTNKSEIVIFNRFAEELTGYKADEVIGKRWIDIFIEKDERENLFKLWDILVRDKIKNTNENYIVTKNQEMRLIRWNNIVLKDIEENDFVLSIGLDITEQFEYEKKMQIQNKRLSMLLDIGATLVQSQSLEDIYNKIAFSVSKFIDQVSVAVYSIKENMLYLNST